MADIDGISLMALKLSTTNAAHADVCISLKPAARHHKNKSGHGLQYIMCLLNVLYARRGFMPLYPGAAINHDDDSASAFVCRQWKAMSFVLKGACNTNFSTLRRGVILWRPAILAGNQHRHQVATGEATHGR